MSKLPQTNEITISPISINSSQIAQYFGIEKKELNRILLKLKWLKRKYFLWLEPTKLGEGRGASKKKREILWNRKILGDKELLLSIQDVQKESVDYKKYRNKVYEKYKQDGYTIWNYAKEKGNYNRNIHFVAKKDREVLLIHCKSDKQDIKLEELLHFRENKRDFITENPIFSMYNLKIQYSMSHFLLSEEAFKYLQENIDTFSYEILK